MDSKKRPLGLRQHTAAHQQPLTCPTLNAATSPVAFYLKDTATDTHFLVDTGACRSFIKPQPGYRPSRYQGPPIYTANGQSLKVYGLRTLPLTLQGRHYKWEFLVADVSRPLLGADFLKAYNIAVDVASGRLLHTREWPYASNSTPHNSNGSPPPPKRM